MGMGGNGNGNDFMGMGGNGNSKSHSRTPLFASIKSRWSNCSQTSKNEENSGLHSSTEETNNATDYERC